MLRFRLFSLLAFAATVAGLTYCWFVIQPNAFWIDQDGAAFAYGPDDATFVAVDNNMAGLTRFLFVPLWVVGLLGLVLFASCFGAGMLYGRKSHRE